MINYFRIGKIISIHGLKGECKVFPTCDDIKRFDKLEECFLFKDSDIEKETDKAIKVNIENKKFVSKFVALKFKGIENIDDIKKYIGYEIYVDRKFSEKTKENEYYISDLLDLNIVGNENKVIGRVIEISETKVNYNLTVCINNKKYYLPFIKDYIIKIDIENGFIFINEEGLLDI